MADIELKSVSDPLANPKGAAVSEERKMTTWEKVVGIFVFAGIGVISLLPWNFYLFLFPYIEQNYWNGEAWINATLGSTQIGSFTVQVLLIIFRQSGSTIGLQLGLLLAFLSCFFTPFVLMLDSHYGPRVLQLVALFIGSSSGILQGIGFCVAGVFPMNFIPCIVWSQAMSGLFSFAMSCLLGMALFNVELKDDIGKMAWVSFMLTAAISLIVMCVSIYFFYFMPSIRRRMIEISKKEKKVTNENKEACESTLDGSFEDSDKKTEGKKDATDKKIEGNNNDVIVLEEGGPDHTAEADPTEDDSYRRPYKEIIKDAWVPVVMTFITFFITLNMFPKVGPLSWRFNHTFPGNLLIYFGLYQVGDFLGRFTPDVAGLSKKLSFFFISKRLLIALTLLRSLFYVLFFVPAKIEGNAFFNNSCMLGIFMVLLAYTHGYLFCLCVIYSSTYVKTTAERKLTSPAVVIALILGIISGLYLAILY